MSKDADFHKWVCEQLDEMGFPVASVYVQHLHGERRFWLWFTALLLITNTATIGVAFAMEVLK